MTEALRDEGPLEEAAERDGTVFVPDGGDEDGDAEGGERREGGVLEAIVVAIEPATRNVPATAHDARRDRPQRNPVRVAPNSELSTPSPSRVHEPNDPTTSCWPLLPLRVIPVSVTKFQCLALIITTKHHPLGSHTSLRWTPIFSLRGKDTRRGGRL